MCPGEACAATGDEIHVPAQVSFDLARSSAPEDDDCVPCPCPPGPPMGSRTAGATVRYLAIRYACRPARPVRVGHADCRCGDSGCETSRFRDDFELTLLADLPVPYDDQSVKAEEDWLEKFKQAAADGILFGLEPRPCNQAALGPWVILATVTGDLTQPPPSGGAVGEPLAILNANLSATLTLQKRRLLPRAQDLLAAFMA